MYATNHRWMRSFGIALILVLGISGIAQSRGVPPPAVPPGGAGIAAGGADVPAAQAAALAPQQQVALPSGAVMFFDLDACPEGWSELPAARGRYLVGLVPGGQRAAAVGTALGDQESRPAGQHSHDVQVNDPGHGHAINDPGHSHAVDDPGHSHGITDPGHQHSGWHISKGDKRFDYNANDGVEDTTSTSRSTTGITINRSPSNVTVQGNTTGVSLLNAATGITAVAEPDPDTPTGTNAPYIQLLVCRKN